MKPWKLRGFRRLIGDAMALPLVGAWLLSTGIFIACMQVVNRIEGRRVK